MEYRLDDQWYKPICEQCPYFVVTEKEEERSTARCERSVLEPCLANSFLVQRQLMLQRLTTATLLKKTLDTGIKPFISKKKRKKIAGIKRRR